MRYVVFLRAINIGGRRVRMADLRAAFSDAGYGTVETHIATGNVILERSERPERVAIESVIEARFGFVSEAFIRDELEMRSIVARNPWTHPDALVEVSMLESEPDEAAARTLEDGVAPPEALSVSVAEVFFLREGKGIPTVHKESTTERTLGMRTTRRGMATIAQIDERHLRA